MFLANLPDTILIAVNTSMSSASFLAVLQQASFTFITSVFLIVRLVFRALHLPLEVRSSFERIILKIFLRNL